jgi:hypothetical protein
MSKHKKDEYDKFSFEKLNIENLFSSDGIRPHTNGKIDIETLFKKNNTNEDFDFDPHMLLSTIKKKRKKMKECYDEIFKSCCDTILSADKSGITDIIYEVPHYVPECSNYNTDDCIKILKNKLNEQKLSCLKLNKTKIFITWSNLEEKLSSNENIEQDDDKHTYQN